MTANVKKPGYSTTKAGLALSWALAWLLLVMITYAGVFLDKPQAHALAVIVFPSMVALIVSILGIHRAFGSIDMRTMAGASKPTTSDDEEQK